MLIDRWFWLRVLQWTFGVSNAYSLIGFIVGKEYLLALMTVAVILVFASWKFPKEDNGNT